MAVYKTSYGTFCDREWDKIELSQQDRFCGQCQKTVHDFANWDRESLINHFKSNPKLCGRFTIQQISPELIPIESAISFPRRIVFATITFLGLQHMVAQENFKPKEKIELAPSSQNDDKLDTTKREETNTSQQTAIKNPDNVTSSQNDLPSRKEKKHYLSWRFPFIHRISTGTSTKQYHVIGCPAF